MGKMAELWAQMRTTGDHRIHAEFGDFSNVEFFKVFEKHAVRNANSLGMNEQEIKMLLRYWKNPDIQSLEAVNSQPGFNEILKDVRTFFKLQKEKGLDISRLHLHPFGSFLMCYDTSKWSDARAAIIKSSLAVPKYCIKGPESSKMWVTDQDFSTFGVDSMPKEFEHPSIPGHKISTSKDSLTYDFDLDEHVHCYAQFFIKCGKVYKTAGMGDTISGMGFMYHEPL